MSWGKWFYFQHACWAKLIWKLVLSPDRCHFYIVVNKIVLRHPSQKRKSTVRVTNTKLKSRKEWTRANRNKAAVPYVVLTQFEYFTVTDTHLQHHCTVHMSKGNVPVLWLNCIRHKHATRAAHLKTPHIRCTCIGR